MNVDYSGQFKKDYKRIKFSGRYNIRELERVIVKLSNNQQLEPKYCDHELNGKLKNVRECHVFPDLLLMYRYVSTGLYLIRLGSHSELFL